jgi:hypothetical protein
MPRKPLCYSLSIHAALPLMFALMSSTAWAQGCLPVHATRTSLSVCLLVPDSMRQGRAATKPTSWTGWSQRTGAKAGWWERVQVAKPQDAFSSRGPQTKTITKNGPQPPETLDNIVRGSRIRF